MKITTKLKLKYYRIMKRFVEIPTPIMFLPLFLLAFIMTISGKYIFYVAGIMVALLFFYFYIIFFGLGLIEREKRIKSNINECSIIVLLIYYITVFYVIYNLGEKLKWIFDFDFGLVFTFLQLILLFILEYIIFLLPLALVLTMKYNRHLVKREDWRIDQYYEGIFFMSFILLFNIVTLINFYLELREDLIRNAIVSDRDQITEFLIDKIQRINDKIQRW